MDGPAIEDPNFWIKAREQHDLAIKGRTMDKKITKLNHVKGQSKVKMVDRLDTKDEWEAQLIPIHDMLEEVSSQLGCGLLCDADGADYGSPGVKIKKMTAEDREEASERHGHISAVMAVLEMAMGLSGEELLKKKSEMFVKEAMRKEKKQYALFYMGKKLMEGTEREVNAYFRKNYPLLITINLHEKGFALVPIVE